MSNCNFFDDSSNIEDEEYTTINRTDDGQPIFKMSKCILQPSERINVCNKVENIRQNIDDLNTKIVHLLNVRSMMLSLVNSHIANICGSEYFLGYKLNTIYDEWYSKNFESDIIRNCVSNIRDIFFDKSVEKFKEFICDDIHINSNNWDGSIGFTFSKMDHSNEFTILVPTLIPNHSLPHSALSTNREYIDFSENLGVGEICVAVDSGIWSRFGLFSSLSINKMRDFIKKLIENYDTVVNDAVTKENSYWSSKKIDNIYDTNSNTTQTNFSYTTQTNFSYDFNFQNDDNVKEIETKNHMPLNMMLAENLY